VSRPVTVSRIRLSVFHRFHAWPRKSNNTVPAVVAGCKAIKAKGC
jgi:hypothetical protein